MDNLNFSDEDYNRWLMNDRPQRISDYHRIIIERRTVACSLSLDDAMEIQEELEAMHIKAEILNHIEEKKRHSHNKKFNFAF